jgi:hypothetical protein
MIVIDEFSQLSDQWFAEHAGIPGAASNDKIITSTGKRSTQRKDHMFKLAAEALLGEKERGYTNATMDAGTCSAFCMMLKFTKSECAIGMNRKNIYAALTD